MWQRSGDAWVEEKRLRKRQVLESECLGIYLEGWIAVVEGSMWLVADDDEKVRREEAALVVWFRSSQTPWGWKLGGGGGCTISGANHGRCLEARQARQGKAGKGPCGDFEAAQRHLRQIPRLQSGPKEVLLGSDRAEETAQGKSVRDCSGGARKGRKDGQGMTKEIQLRTVEDLHLRS